MNTICESKGCRTKADHLLLPQGIDLCFKHYRKRRPYAVSIAAFDEFKDMLTPAERRKWQGIVDEQQQQHATLDEMNDVEQDGLGL